MGLNLVDGGFLVPDFERWKPVLLFFRASDDSPVTQIFPPL